MKSIKLNFFEESCNEAVIAIRLFQLFHGRFLNELSTNPDKYLRSKLNKFKKDGSILSFLSENQNTSLIDLVKRTGIALNFWVVPSEQSDDIIIPKLVRSFHCHDPFYGTVNLIVDRKKSEINIESGLRLIVDDSFIKKIHDTCLNFNQNVSIFTGFPLSYIDQLWSSRFSLLDERNFANIFGFGFQIWEAETKFCTKIKKLVPVTKRLFKSSQSKFMTLQVVNIGWDHEKYMIDSSDLFVLRNADDFNLFVCPKSWCFFNTNQIAEFDRHVPNCTNETTVKFSQRNLLSESAKEFLIRKGFMSNFDCLNLAAFDIETFGVPEDTHLSEKTLVKTCHRLVSISVSPNFGTLGTKVFMRDDWSEESLDKIIKDFWNFVLQIRDQHVSSLPQDIHTARERVEFLLKESLPPNEKAQLYRAKRYLKSLFNLNLIGFNNERFDNVVLFPSLLKIWDPKNSNSKDHPLDVIKRGNGLMTIRYDGVNVNDAHNFYVSGSLDSFGTRFHAPVQKLIWPYEHFDCISQLNSAIFPEFRAFKNTLKQHNDTSNVIDSMYKAYQYANIHLKLTPSQFFEKFNIYDAFEPFEVSDVFPNDLRLKPNMDHFFPVDPLTYVTVWHQYEQGLENGQFYTLRDYLAYYNEVDTIVTATAFTNMAKLFLEKFKINLLDYPSLPSAALQILWRFYDRTCDAPYTFAQNYDWVAKNFRDQLQGGFAGPMHRHVEIGPTAMKYDDAVHYAPNGQPLVCLRLDDFSNLYGFSCEQDLPAGIGHAFVKNDTGTFDTSLMLQTENTDRGPFKSKFSKESLEWLSYMQGLPQFKDHKIEHFCNGGERRCNLDDFEFFPDGFVQIANHSFYLQYYGCAFHDHKCAISKKSPFIRPKTEQRNKKINELCQKYGTLITIFSCEWKQLRKNVTYKHVISKFFNQKNIIQSAIFDAIIAGDIYGFVCCDIRSPQSVIDFYMQLNWPPIMAKVTPESDMISPTILARMKANGQKIETEQLTQVFNASKHLISTEFFQFYHSMGLELSNIEYVIEYSRCRPVKKFVNEVTACRKQAVLTNQKELQEIYKVNLFDNSPLREPFIINYRL